MDQFVINGGDRTYLLKQSQTCKELVLWFYPGITAGIKLIWDEVCHQKTHAARRVLWMLCFGTRHSQSKPYPLDLQYKKCLLHFFLFSQSFGFFMARSPLNVYKCDILQSEWCKALKKKDLFRDHERLRWDTTGYQFSLRPCQRDRAPIWRYINFVIEKGLHLPLDSFILFLSCWAALSAKCRL